MTPEQWAGEIWSHLLEAFQAAIAEEREACAKIAEQWPPDGLLPATSQQWFEDIAAAIRARP